MNLGSIPLVDLGQPSICDGQSAVLDAGAGFASYAWSTGATTQTITVSTAGIITVTVTNAAGCVGSDVVNVSQSSMPVAAFTIVFQGYDLQFIDNSTYGTTYSWNYGDGSALGTTPGTNSHSYSSSNIYTIRLTVTNACGTDTACQSSYAGEVGFAEPWLAQFDLYPNPATTVLNLDLELKKAMALSWIVIDAKGSEVLQGNAGRVAGNFRKEFDLQALPSGMYRLLLLADGQPIARSFVKY